MPKKQPRLLSPFLPMQGQESVFCGTNGSSSARQACERDTQPAALLSPYEISLKIVYEYFRDDLEAADICQLRLPKGFLALAYQREAVAAARKALELHGGVFLSDVVGLGKTCIAALTLQSLPGKKLVICPPALQTYWQQSLAAFYVHEAQVLSAGRLPGARPERFSGFSQIVVDESHRFRNEKSKSYNVLRQLCRGKKVILLSATPFNNNLADLLAQIRLFQDGKNSTIPGLPNLEGFFRQKNRAFRSIDPASPNFAGLAETLAADIRENVLKHIMVRRTRAEVTKYFAADLAQNGLAFPEIAQPQPLVYEFDATLEEVFNETIALLKKLTYARYSPALYLKDGASQIQALNQQNIRAFIKSTLVKRLESSFHAFGLTIERFLQACAGIARKNMPQDRKFLESCGIEAELFAPEADLCAKLAEDAIDIQFKKDLDNDLATLRQIKRLWGKITVDPKLDALLDAVKTHPVLAGNKAIIFTESADTASYIYEQLDKCQTGQTLMFSSQKAKYRRQVISSALARELIRRNFDPLLTDAGELKLLVTTDVLAEGMNLHRAGAIVNYDLPWNPTRVMQRLGRINRVGTSQAKLYIFNFFPVATADKHLGLRENVNKKIAAFNAVLGNDNKILFETENPDPHGLFQKLGMAGEEKGENPELAHLCQLRALRANAPQLYEKIRKLPLTAVSARFCPELANSTLIFSREKLLKKFLLVNNTTRILSFAEAARIFQALATDEPAPLPKDFNFKKACASQLLQITRVSGTSRSAAVNHLLDAITGLQKLSAVSCADRAYLAKLLTAVRQAAVSKRGIAALAKAIKKQQTDPQTLIQNFRQIADMPTLANLENDSHSPPSQDTLPKVTLALYLAPANALQPPRN